MPFQLPHLRVGQTLTCNNLSVFPLYTEVTTPIDYQLADEAMAASTVTVQEVSEGGSVPQLLVENRSDRRVLFLEGEELRGAKQNRILNTSILVAARSTLKVPVSCVEQGRWRYASRQFASSRTRSPLSLHYKLKASVARSLKESGEHHADQGEVWQEVEKQQAAFGFCSPTSALADTYDSLAEQMTDYREKLKYPEGAVGVAVAVGPRLVCFDLFDQPATCQKAWDRLLSGCILGSLQGGAADALADAQVVEQAVAASQTTPWTEAPTVGEGQEYRAEFQGSMGSALMLSGAVVHLNVLAPPD